MEDIYSIYAWIMGGFALFLIYVAYATVKTVRGLTWPKDDDGNEIDREPLWRYAAYVVLSLAVLVIVYHALPQHLQNKLTERAQYFRDMDRKFGYSILL